MTTIVNHSRIDSNEAAARIRPYVITAYRRMMSGTPAEAAALAYTPSGPPMEELEQRIIEFRAEANAATSRVNQHERRARLSTHLKDHQ